MLNIVQRVQSWFTKKKSVEFDSNLFLCHIVYDKNSKTASLFIDYDNIFKKSPLSNEDIINDSDQFANFLYSLCSVKGFLPALILEDLNLHKNDSPQHNFFISATLAYLDQVLVAKNNSNKKPLIRPSQVFKNGQ